MLAAAPAEIAGQALFDAATHEHDLRNALGRDRRARQRRHRAPAGSGSSTRARAAGAPAICFVVEAGEQVSGVGDVVARVEAPRFELFRAVTGRRTAEEIARYGWDREPDPELLLAAEFFSIPADSIGE